MRPQVLGFHSFQVWSWQLQWGGPGRNLCSGLYGWSSFVVWSLASLGNDLKLAERYWWCQIDHRFWPIFVSTIFAQGQVWEHWKAAPHSHKEMPPVLPRFGAPSFSPCFARYQGIPRSTWGCVKIGYPLVSIGIHWYPWSPPKIDDLLYPFPLKRWNGNS